MFLVFRGVFATLCVRRNENTFEVGVDHERCFDLFVNVEELDNRIFGERCLLSTVSETLELVFITSSLGIFQACALSGNRFPNKTM